MAHLALGYYNFIHFGLNTFTKKEWGSGTVPPEAFEIRDIDTDAWCEALQSTGSRGIIITAKHHDGFCLFPSAYTDYTIAKTEYQNGKGDIICQLSNSCKKYRLKLGIYLSPWDRHEPTYGTGAYNDFFCNQLTEICTRYGEIFCFWFDGACGEGKNGKTQVYDWQRYFRVIRSLQPNAVIANCGEDIRWVGNEHGIARKAEWSVVPKRLQCYDKVMEQSQQEAGAFRMLAKISNSDKNLGDISTISPEEELCYWPSEMNIPITYFGWFYRPFFEIFFTRSVRNLVKCYCNSVGNNSTILVNVPPDQNGRLPRKFIFRLIEARRRLEKLFANQICEKTFEPGENFTVEFDQEQSVSKVVIMENIAEGQRIARFTLLADGREIYRGETVGFKKFCFFKAVICKKIEIAVMDSWREPIVKSISVYR
ncbi:MAG: alpha-L-fucosidase [Clostridia bacterium]